MNVLKKISYLLLLFVMFISVGFSFNVCNVDINEPWFIVNDSSGNSVFIVDNEGDIYFEGIDHTLDNENVVESFELGINHFNSQTSKFANFTQDLAVLPIALDSLIIRSSSGDNVTLFAQTGEISTKGKGVYENSQAGCSPDGLYCNLNILEDRDYYCDITGNKTGSCTHSIVSSENCLTKVSDDSDGGYNIWSQGTLKDYTGCLTNACTFDSFTDSCTSATNLKEYSPSGSFYAINNVDCTASNYYYCSGLNRRLVTHDCSIGKCEVNGNTFVETCVAPSPSYSSWSCSSSTQRVRVVTTYSPTCAAAGCGISSSNSNEYETAPSGFVCASGNWVVAPKIISLTASPNPWTIFYPTVAPVTICMTSVGATSCSWCGVTMPCNGCQGYTNGGTHTSGVCLAVASNAFGDSDSKFGTSSVVCSGVGIGTGTYNGWGGTCPVGESYCKTGTPLDCYNYQWDVVGSWSTCIAGTQTKTVICKRLPDGITVADSYCSGVKPIVSQSCTVPCPPKVTIGWCDSGKMTPVKTDPADCRYACWSSGDWNCARGVAGSATISIYLYCGAGASGGSYVGQTGWS